jgi:hypothetical protein
VDRKQKHVAIGVEFFVSILMAFCWVSSYRYKYNIPFFNSPLLNWWAFLLWSIGLFITLRTYQWFKLTIKLFWVRILVLWISYFITLLVIEYLGYHVFIIRETTSEKPLCFGLIHGTPIMKIYYLTAGIIAIILSSVFKKSLPIIFLSGQKQGPENPET